jgi:REP element-mobilizing transposase RayT
MPRKARIDIPGLLQHVIVRSIERRKIFIDDDRQIILARFSSLLEETGTDCFAWALLGNHVKAKSTKGVKKIYQVVRISAIGIKRHIKIKAAVNPYLPEYARYIWERRHKKGSKELAANTAREFRAMVAAS